MIIPLLIISKLFLNVCLNVFILTKILHFKDITFFYIYIYIKKSETHAQKKDKIIF